jgi:hypothetical protein
MADSRLTLVKLLARIRPEVWEVIGAGFPPPDDPGTPRAPEWWPKGWPPPPPSPIWSQMGGLPDPWRAASWALAAQMGAVGLTMRLTDAMSTVHIQSGEGPAFLSSALDDGWGIEGRPPVLVLPAGWRHLIPPPDVPRPNELDVASVLAAGGVSFAAISETLANPDLAKATVDASIRSLDAATGFLNGG